MTNEQEIQAIRDTADAIDGSVRATKRGLPRPSVDGMGKGYIVYWPRITAPVESEA